MAFEQRMDEAAGTKTLLIAANPGQVNLVSPAEIDPALRAGYFSALSSIANPYRYRIPPWAG
jgi:hypothetical protein